MKLSEKIQEYADSNYSEYWRLLYEIWANNARQLESQNAALLEALLLAKGSVEWMADATDADPEDIERLVIVNKAIRKASQ